MSDRPRQVSAPGSDLRTIHVGLGERGYDVHVGPGALGRLGERGLLGAHTRRVALVTQEPVAVNWAVAVETALDSHGVQVDRILIDDGEAAKTLATLEGLWARFSELPLGRDDAVVALGGGVVGDLAGFAASTWHRGIDVIQVPTTLLAQCDAAVGGKTGVNLAHGKNLVGTFWQPRAVIADTVTLSTLPARELVSGLGEVAKYGFIADPTILEDLERDPDAATGGDPALLADIVSAGVSVKADFVTGDERESGRRALLNYGHTFGHAIESLTGYTRYLHGEAVALGMVAAARLGESIGHSETGLADRTVAMLDALGLPTGGAPVAVSDVRRAMARDKKARDGIRVVLCSRPGHAEVVDGLEPAALDAAIASVTG